MKNSKLKKILLGLLKLLYYIAIAFVCLIVGILIYYIISVQIHADDKDYKPGISIYTIVSPSMTPEIKVYDVVVNVRVTNPEKIEIGDIITFKSQAATSEGMTITHRVIAREKLPDGTYEYMTQGDANPEPDSSYVTFDNVIGEKILIIPGLGKVQFLIANKKSWLFLLLIPISIYLIKEIYKLIDLLGLKKKVKKVIDEPEEEPQIDHEKQEALKQQLRKELFGSEEKQSNLTRSESEKEGFLEKYSETIVKVTEDKPSQVISPTKPLVREEKLEKPKPVVKKAEENLGFELPKMKEYEVLETSDILPEKEKEYLEGSRIKVVKVEETKNKKKDRNSTRKVTKQKDDNKIDLNSEAIIPTKNPNLKIDRPESEDIKELRREQTNNKQQPKEPPKKKNLKLNPNKVKKINRNKPNSNRNNNKKQLNLNPRNVKKVNRYKKQNNQPPKKKKQPLIIIEKIK